MKLLFLPILTMLLLAQTGTAAGDSNVVHVALIFDDGPTPENTQKLLAIFKKEHIHVTFGSIATNVQAHPAAAKAVIAAGHEIANHSYSHVHPKDVDDATLEREIVGAQKIIADITGFSPKWYWPPFIEIDDRVRATAAKAHIKVYVPGKLVVSEDYNANVSADEIKRKATTGVVDGTVILFHEWRNEMIEQLPAIIAELRRQHCAFLTFTELAEHVGSAKRL